MRPVDEELPDRRRFSSLDFRDGSINGFNAEVQTLFFEGDFGEVFPHLDPLDVLRLDYGFSVGRMPLLAQQGLLDQRRSHGRRDGHSQHIVHQADT